ncbi:MAG: FHA domain-containing protein, partial [Verrucomicrobia bacterium]|nr:FHA domain-containing protein [Verrucomicrobiota bacterium]
MQTLKLQYRTWDEREITLSLGPGKHRMGRTSDNDVVIDELAVSDHHCILVIEENGATIMDNGSIHGTFVDGVLVENCQVGSGQIINLGTLMVKLLESEDPSPGPVGQKTES